MRGERDRCDVGNGEVDLLCLCLDIDDGNRIDPHDGQERALRVELEELDVRSFGREKERGRGRKGSNGFAWRAKRTCFCEGYGS